MGSLNCPDSRMVRKNRVPQGATALRVNHARNDLPCSVDVDVGGGFTSNIFEIEIENAVGDD